MHRVAVVAGRVPRELLVARRVLSPLVAVDVALPLGLLLLAALPAFPTLTLVDEQHVLGEELFTHRAGRLPVAARTSARSGRQQVGRRPATTAGGSRGRAPASWVQSVGINGGHDGVLTPRGGGG